MKDAKRKGTGFSNRMIKRAPTRSSASAFGKGEGRLLRTLEAVQQDLWQRLVEVSPQAIHELCPDLRHQSSDLPHRSEAALHSEPLKQQFSQDQRRAILWFELALSGDESAAKIRLQYWGWRLARAAWLLTEQVPTYVWHADDTISTLSGASGRLVEAAAYHLVGPFRSSLTLSHLLGTFSCERSGVAFLSCCKRKSSSIAATVT